MPIFDQQSAKLYYEVAGKGSPVIFVNGWTMSCEYWRPLIAQLEKNHNCLIYDQRGFARSQPLSNDAGVELEDHADDLHEMLVQLRIKDVHIVAHGIGVWIAVLCIRQHPQDAVTLTAISPEIEQQSSTPDKSPNSPEELPSFWQQASLLLKDLAAIPMLRNLVSWRNRQAPEPYRTKLFEDFSHADRRAAYHMLASLKSADTRNRLLRALEEISTPVMLARGSEDADCNSTQLRALFDIIKSGKMATVKASGHFPMLDFTSDFAQLLQVFFSQHPGPQRHKMLKSGNL